MSSTTALKRRIGSVKNTKQITKAMELVAASKMKKAQDHAVSSRDYRLAAKSILSRVSGVTDVSNHPLFEKRKVKTKLIMVITSDRGLAGAYNSNIFRLLTKRINEDKSKGVDVEVVAIGRQAGHFLPRIKDVKTTAVYPMFTGKPSETEIRNIANPIFQKYLDKQIDAVEVIYTNFISNISQEATAITLLPEELNKNGKDSKDISDLEVAIFEPNIEDIVEDLTRRLLQVQIWQVLLESLASEHSMRMMAMKSATDNANDIIDDLTLAYNTARQAAITQEIAEIVGGAEAVNA